MVFCCAGICDWNDGQNSPLVAAYAVGIPGNQIEDYNDRRKELQGMACGSSHAVDPLIEHHEESQAAESQAAGQQRGVKVVDWGSHAEGGRRAFAEWAVEGGVPVVLRGTDLAAWVGDLSQTDSKGRLVLVSL